MAYAHWVVLNAIQTIDDEVIGSSYYLSLQSVVNIAVSIVCIKITLK